MMCKIVNLNLTICKRNCEMILLYSFLNDLAIAYRKINIFFDENDLAFFVLDKTDREIISKCNTTSLKYDAKNNKIIINKITAQQIILNDADKFFERIKNIMNNYYKKIFDKDGILPDTPHQRF